MRNLRLLRNINLHIAQLNSAYKYCVVNSKDCGDLKSTRFQCFIICDDFKVYCLQIRCNIVENIVLIVDLNADFSKHENIKAVELAYLFNHLYIILSDGQLVTVLLEGEDIEVRKTHLSINDIARVVWSPDISRTIIVDSNNDLFVLHIADNTFKILSEISLQNESQEQNLFVNVGWGSIETQFRGSEGKYSSMKPIEPTVAESCCDAAVNISWKQNSTAFAVSYLCKSTNIRRIKIFNQDGGLLNVTKDIRGLHSSIDWCSSRNLISVVQKLPNKTVLCFLEENALKHGDFQIKDDSQVIQLLWNSNGNILACHELTPMGHVVSLWTTSNYKWYQKQYLKFSNYVVYLQWDFDVPNRLHIILDNGYYRLYEWTFQVIESNQCNENVNPCLVAVINDSHLNLTPYRQLCQPPSMPHFVFDASAAINAVVFPTVCESSEQTHSHSIFLYLSNNKFLLLNHENSSQDLYCFNFGDANTEIEYETPLEMSLWLWLYPDYLYFSWSSVDEIYFCASFVDSETRSIVLKSMFKLDSIILAITNYKSDVIVHTEDGTLYVFHDNQFLRMMFSLIEPWIQLQALNSTVLIGLGEHRNLYVNESIKWRDVLSFYWRPPFLVLIKLSCQLLITKVDFSNESVNFSEVQTRQIEPKSYLITIVDDQVMLEMERGNLEIIRPRPFSIFKMEQMLRDEKYYEVFKMLRKQRINLNVIFDHDSESFLKNVKNIVEVSDPMYLSTFITELVDNNVAKDMFPWKYGKIDVIDQKVKLICETLISSIKEYNIKKLINPLIAALVRLGKLADAANYAIEHEEIASLWHLADPIATYKATLGSFNITCALTIIQHSKLDPSEYLPFIHELQATEENYRKFKICNYLEKYVEALQYIADCDDKFDECVAFIHKHRLYRSALDLFSSRNKSIKAIDPKYVQILTINADFYFSARLFEDAGILYEKAGLLQKAFDCYLAVGDWLSVISTYALMEDKLSPMEVYNSLYETLLKRGQYIDAAFIAFNYSKNCKQAVDAFLKAKKFCSALNAAKGLRHEEVIEDIIHPQLLSEMKSTVEHLQSDAKTIKTYAERLLHLREKKRNKELGINDDGVSSVYSFATSTTTESTDSMSSSNSRTSTSCSARRLRRQERKLWNLKKGNPREEPSLTAALKDIFTVAEKSYPELVSDLLKALMKTDEIESSRILQKEYFDFRNVLLLERRRIWPYEGLTEEGGFKDIWIRCRPDINVSMELVNF